MRRGSSLGVIAACDCDLMSYRGLADIIVFLLVRDLQTRPQSLTRSPSADRSIFPHVAELKFSRRSFSLRPIVTTSFDVEFITMLLNSSNR